MFSHIASHSADPRELEQERLLLLEALMETFPNMTSNSGIMDLLGASFPLSTPPRQSKAKQFVPSKKLSDRDQVIIDVLNSEGHDHICFCVSDPDKFDMPIVFASDSFCDFTGYSRNDVVGRNCRFLQGQATNQNSVNRIREGIKDQREISVNLVNYHQNGTEFLNQFFLSPLRNSAGKLLYFIGVQCDVSITCQKRAAANDAKLQLKGFK